MIDMIDEALLEALLAQIADDIPVPDDGPDHIEDAFALASSPDDRPRRRYPIVLAVAAAAIVLALILVPILNSNSSPTRVATSAPAPPTTVASGSAGSVVHGPLRSGGAFSDGGVTSQAGGTQKSTAVAGGTSFSPAALPGAVATSGASAAVGSGSGTAPPAASGTVDGAKIVKTGTLDLQTAHATLHDTVNRLIGTTIGLGGYIADSNTSYAGTSPNAQITIRVPVGNFETAVTRLDGMPGVTVLSDSESGADVTKQYTNLQAQLSAATAERNAFLVVLSHAQSIGDILAVNDRVTAAQTTVDELQGQINDLNDQASFSSIAVTLAEKTVHPKPAVVHHASVQTGLAKSWSDARHGFASSIEWLIARSGGALIALLAALALLFGLRYLYPIVRRALV